MNKCKFAFLILLICPSLACSKGSYSAQVGFTNGSTSGTHIVSEMLITTVSGGQASFSMGAVDGYPGAFSTGGRMDAPAHIEGYWAKEGLTPSSELVSFHRISMSLPKNAEAKMKLMDNYYQNYEKRRGRMQVIVDGPRVRVFYTKTCLSKFNDCTPKKDIDPNGWVIKSPRNITDVVLLFDGIGESSVTPLPGTHFFEADKNNMAT